AARPPPPPRRRRENDATALRAFENWRGGGAREPGFAGARRSSSEDQRVAAQRADIGVLRRGARAHGTLAQVDLLERRPRGRRVVVEQRALRDRQADRAFDV